APSFRALRKKEGPVHCDALEGTELISELLIVGQDPVGRTPRANALSYTKAADDVRTIFALGDAARRAGLKASHFSLNAPGGRCERCSGDGHERIEMQFLAPVFVRCEECGGRRFREEILAIKDRGKSIADVLDMSVREALEFYADHAGIVGKLSSLESVGLGYLRLGQPLNTLSGGEAQRLKLAHLLGSALASRRGALPLALVLDEPTAGLHLADVQGLLRALDALARAGHAVVVVEHHLDVISSADHVIELGPGGGPEGGRKVYEGDLAGLMTCKGSPTGEVLRARSRSRSRSRPLPSTSTSTSTKEDAIHIRGAREHNLKGVSISIPRRALTVVSGLSGSGKSTLAFDVLFREGQRRYLDTLSPYARQFVARGERPDVDEIAGVPPTVAIEQRTSRYGRMSTVATVVELHPWLRVLYANAGEAHCPACQVAIAPETVDALARKVARAFGGSHSALLAPVIRSRKGHHRPVFERLEGMKKRFVEVDGAMFDLEDGYPVCDRYREHDIAVRIDDGLIPARDARKVVEEALAIGEGTFKVRAADGSSIWFSAARTCPKCGRGFEPLDVRLFTWTSRKGRCSRCLGLGIEGVHYDGEASDLEAVEATDDAEACRACHGARLNDLARSVRLAGITLPELCGCPVEELPPLLEKLEQVLDARGREVARPVLRGVRKRLEFLEEVGLGYLSLDRSADTLSGGEAQRLRLAAQLGAGLTGVLYVLDEPTIGLHPRDSDRLIQALRGLRDAGNTVVVVEHDERVIRSADYLVDLGPGAGREGGEIVAHGTVAEVARDERSLTGRYLAGIETPASALGKRRPIDGAALVLRGACARNLKGLDLRVPVGTLVAVSGVSGSGKSTLVRDVFLRAVQDAMRGDPKARDHESIEGVELIARAAEVDQSPIGRTPRSVPATYVGMFDSLRELFARTTEARSRGFGKERFSFNASQGRCAECEGQGRVRVEMAFLPTVEVPCESCEGARFDRTTLEARFAGLSIAQVLALTVAEARGVFEHHTRIARSLELLDEVGLSYLQLGQPSTQLSGGEAQRIKLVRELSKKARGRSLFVLDEPTTGLHAADVARLVRALQRLVDRGDTVVVIEHNLEVLAASDLVYDLGPEGGSKGGEVVACGPPLEIARAPGRSHTARLLRSVIGGRALTSSRAPGTSR
ncbi:MAG TPA: ATP-binding cassette domain-containing protein, partial [Planctomycetota bacterium]|nr:ATP-binding cassette domain-containing protein [Planctomycetota bacterium]